MYVDKAEENIKQHLRVIHLEDGKGITRINYELNVNNDISVLYNCKDATKTKQKTPSLATQSINNTNIDLSSITKPNNFNVAVAIEIFIPTSLFGSISLTLEKRTNNRNLFLLLSLQMCCTSKNPAVLRLPTSICML